MQQNGKQQRSRIQMQSLKIYWSWLWQLNLWWKTSITLKPEGKMNVSVGIYSHMYVTGYGRQYAQNFWESAGGVTNGQQYSQWIEYQAWRVVLWHCSINFPKSKWCQHSYILVDHSAMFRTSSINNETAWSLRAKRILMANSRPHDLQILHIRS